jgi:hypothetical protein
VRDQFPSGGLAHFRARAGGERVDEAREHLALTGLEQPAVVGERLSAWPTGSSSVDHVGAMMPSTLRSSA